MNWCNTLFLTYEQVSTAAQSYFKLIIATNIFKITKAGKEEDGLDFEIQIQITISCDTACQVPHSTSLISDKTLLFNCGFFGLKIRQ